MEMESTIHPDWLILPALVWIGLHHDEGRLTSLETLHRCRQVCRAWNELIVNNIWVCFNGGLIN